VSHPMTKNLVAGTRNLLIVISAIVGGWLVSRFWLYPALGIPSYAPLVLRPILGFLAAWWVLRKSGRSWSDLGLRRPPNLLVAGIVTILLYAATWALFAYAVPVIATMVDAQSAPPFLAYIRGNPAALFEWLCVAWLVGGFSEELLFRAFFLNEIAGLLRPVWLGRSIAIVLQAALFGSLHLYQGTLGFVGAGLFAILFGVAYLANGRNLWPLILVHAIFDCVGIVGVYYS
jgi:membrane protease YdiL (CAAX protease family)